MSAPGDTRRARAFLSAEPAGAHDADQRPRRAWLLANTVVAVEFTASSLLGLLGALQTGLTPERVVVAVLGTAILLTIQLCYFGRPATRLRSGLSVLLLVAQAIVVYLPIVQLGGSWTSNLAFVAGSAPLVLGRWQGWTVYGLVVASTAAIQANLPGVPLDLYYDTVFTAVSGLSIFALTRLARLVTELSDARSQLAVAAVGEERRRFARDLHELLGLNLSAIALRGELTHRLVTRNADRARQELREINDIARRALAGVRTVARGYRELSLEQEFTAARSLLADAEVDLRLDLNHRDLPVQVRTLLATVLHEGVSNVLRHSDVRHCRITLGRTGDRVSLDIVNDGLRTPAHPAENAGDVVSRGRTRLVELSARVATAGGTLTAGVEPGGTEFRLRVDIPAGERQARYDARPAQDTADVAPSGSTLRGRSAAAVLALIISGFALAASIHVLYLTSRPGQIALTVGHLAALLALQLGYFSRVNARLRSRQAYALLFVQACLIYLPLLQLREAWVSMPGLLVANLLLMLRPALSWPLAAAVVASVAWVHAGFTADMGGIPFNVLATVNTGVIAFGMTWLSRVATDLDTARRRLAEVAVTEERLRFARDLHDLLGLSLSAIALKTELAERLLDIDPNRAEKELTEILSLSRQALSDVRSVASGYRELSLDTESRSAADVLAAADVRVRMDLQTHELPVRVRTVLAVVLREGITNVLRHSKVESCEISLRHVDQSVFLEIVNDGVTGDTPSVIAVDDGAGGIRNLSDRVSVLGGQLSAGRDSDGRFRLRVRVPTT